MKSNQSIWAVRVLALAAFATTVWFCGPSAAAVLAARFGSEAQPGPMVILDRVGFTARPDWLDGEMLVSVAESVSPWLSDEVGLLDEETSRRMRDGLMTTPWVHDVRIERVFPDRFRLHLSLRRPIVAVLTGARGVFVGSGVAAMLVLVLGVPAAVAPLRRCPPVLAAGVPVKLR